MGFDLSFALTRPEALAPDELDALARHLLSWRGKILGYDWRVPREPAAAAGEVIAWGTLRPTHGVPEISDQGGYLTAVVDHVHRAMLEARELFHGARLAFADDFGPLAWTPLGFHYSRQAAPPAIPRDDGWISLAEVRDIPQGPQAVEASRAARPRNREAAIAALAAADRARLIHIALTPRDRKLSDVERTAAVERLCLDPDLAVYVALIKLTRDDHRIRKWTEIAMRTLAGGPGRCPWATPLLAFDRGLPGAAELLCAAVTEEAIPHLARLPSSPRWSALALRALDALDGPAARAARRDLLAQVWERFPAAQLAVVDAVLVAQRTLASSRAWTGAGPALAGFDADPETRTALQQVAAAVAAFAAEGGDPAPWLAHERNAGAKALAALDGKRVARDTVNRGLATLAEYAVSQFDRQYLYADHAAELRKLELDWVIANDYPVS